MLVAKSLREMEFWGDTYHGHCKSLLYAQSCYSRSSIHWAYHDIYIILLPSTSGLEKARFS